MTLFSCSMRFFVKTFCLFLTFHSSAALASCRLVIVETFTPRTWRTLWINFSPTQLEIRPAVDSPDAKLSPIKLSAAPEDLDWISKVMRLHSPKEVKVTELSDHVLSIKALGDEYFFSKTGEFIAHKNIEGSSNLVKLNDGSLAFLKQSTTDLFLIRISAEGEVTKSVLFGNKMDLWLPTLGWDQDPLTEIRALVSANNQALLFAYFDRNQNFRVTSINLNGQIISETFAKILNGSSVKLEFSSEVDKEGVLVKATKPVTTKKLEKAPGFDQSTKGDSQFFQIMSDGSILEHPATYQLD